MVIPDTLGGYPVVGIGYSAFWNCTNLKNITIPKSVTWIGDSVFVGCESLTSIVLPNNVTYIDEQMFSGCTNLTSITIPDSVTWIGDRAFASCSITDVFYKGTIEEWYAISIGYGNEILNYAPIHCNYTESSSVSGDLNGDGTVSASDLVSLRKLILLNQEHINADMNGDGVINVKDLIALKKALA